MNVKTVSLEQTQWSAIRQVILDHRECLNIGPGDFTYFVNNTLGEDVEVDMDELLGFIPAEPVL